ncbi:MAG: maleylpyruvate isomerase family mycothiol-dependent enzyme [Acidimicrobiales bacterium]
MTRDELLSSLRADGLTMAALPDSALAVTVPSCPDWDVAALLAHTGWVYRWVSYVLGLGPDERPARDGAPTWNGEGDVRAWFGEGLDAVLAELAAADPERPVATLVGRQPTAWWVRRLAHETAIHRWDAQRALGEPEPHADALAADGVDELLEVMVPRRFDYAGFAGHGETLHLHATDGEGEWLITVGPDSLSWERGHAKGDVAARGPLSDLFLFVWNRVGPDRFEVFGNAELLTRWQAAARF